MAGRKYDEFGFSRVFNMDKTSSMDFAMEAFIGKVLKDIGVTPKPPQPEPFDIETLGEA